MSKEVLTDCEIVLGGYDFQSLANSVTISGDTEVIDVTGFDSSGTREYLLGFKNWTVTIEYWDDFADNALNEVLFGFWGTSQTLTVTKADTTVSATNPKYSGTVLVTNPTFMRAGVGQAAGGSLTLQGTGALQRIVAP